VLGEACFSTWRRFPKVDRADVGFAPFLELEATIGIRPPWVKTPGSGWSFDDCCP
jgi:hypothetical protein